MSLTLRPVAQGDHDFLFELYASTRRDEVAAWGWNAAQEDAFLRMQFIAQQRSYDSESENSSHDIILSDGTPVGRLLVLRTSEEIHLTDIALLSDKRGNGIGSTLIGTLLDEGDATGLPVRLEVLQNNPAVLLYERLGFVQTGKSGLHFLMERRPFGVR